MRLTGPLIVLALIAGCAAPEQVAAPEPSRRINPPFVPTAMEAVEQMLRMAQPRPDDVVYDLGSGDGRIPIQAALRYGVKKAVGIDIDPIRVREGNENARKAGVADRVRFHQGDVFEFDFSEATVVTLYLLQSVNIELRPRLLNELRPGTRIVSNEFHLGDWEPEQTYPGDRPPPVEARVDLTDEDLPHIYAWIVPAKVGGEWRLAFAEVLPVPMHLQQSFQQFSGHVRSGFEPLPIRNGRLTGDRIQFEMTYRDHGREVVHRFDGRVDGSAISGTVTMSDGQTHGFQAYRAN